jgi:hypothetical protein
LDFAKPPRYFPQWGSLAANYHRVVHGGDAAAYADWASQGFASAGEYRIWSDNCCGVACVQSVLDAAGLAVPAIASLIKELVDVRAYTVGDDGHIAGLIYDPCVRWLRQRWAVAAVTCRELSTDEISRCVRNGGLAIASVSSEIRWPTRPATRRGGHLVLVYSSDDVEYVLHNPSGLSGQHAPDQVESAAGAVVPISLFERFFSHRGILLY